MNTDYFTRRRFIASVGALIAGVTPIASSRVFASSGSRPAAEQDSSISASDYCPESEELVFLTLINNYRKANGLSSLKLSRTLGAAADHHSRDMAGKNYFSHTLANGRSWSTNIKDHGYTASGTIAENIAAGQRSASATFDQWRNSSPHRVNMLSSSYTAIGIGRASKSTSTYRYYWTTTFGGKFDSAPSC